jgi:hypothetical protein
LWIRLLQDAQDCLFEIVTLVQGRCDNGNERSWVWDDWVQSSKGPGVSLLLVTWTDVFRKHR